MFIHLGGDCMIKSAKIIMIINAEEEEKKRYKTGFWDKFKETGTIQKVDGENYKSVVITDEKIYFSPISSQTLKKRAGFIRKLVE